MVNKKIAESNKRPVGVEIVAKLHWVLAGFFVFLGIGVFYLFFGFTGQFAYLLLLVVPFLLAVFCFFIGKMIFKGNNRGRIAGIIVGSLLIIYKIYSLIGTEPLTFDIIFFIISLLFLGYIVGYLLFNKKCNAYFKKKI